jgi:hypothetical protein
MKILLTIHTFTVQCIFAAILLVSYHGKTFISLIQNLVIFISLDV